MIGLIVSRNLATLHELQTVYSYEDALDLAEIIIVNNYNDDLLLRQTRKR